MRFLRQRTLQSLSVLTFKETKKILTLLLVLVYIQINNSEFIGQKLKNEIVLSFKTEDLQEPNDWQVLTSITSTTIFIWRGVYLELERRCEVVL